MSQIPEPLGNRVAFWGAVGILLLWAPVVYTLWPQSRVTDLLNPIVLFTALYPLEMLYFGVVVLRARARMTLLAIGCYFAQAFACACVTFLLPYVLHETAYLVLWGVIVLGIGYWHWRARTSFTALLLFYNGFIPILFYLDTIAPASVA